MSRYKPYPAYKDSGVEWLGRVPEHWLRSPIKSLARPGSKTFTDGDWIEAPYITGEGIRLIQTGNIGEGKFKEQGYRYVSDHTFAQFRCTELEPGDILICRLAAPVGRSCLAPRLGVRMITSVDNVILKVAQEKSVQYFVYLFTSLPYLAHVDSICRGGTRGCISRSMLGSIRVPEPPPDEQRRIATFLDRETARIDALIEKKQRLIELLKEKRQAVITQAVTKGLDPNMPMKDSGVEWLGEVPAHWEIVRVGQAFRERSEKGGEGLPVLTISIHYGVTDKEITQEESDRKLQRMEDKEKYKLARDGDIAYNMMRAWQGALGAAAIDGLVSPAYIVATPTRQLVSAYVEAVLRTGSGIQEMRRFSKGITDFRLRLYWDEFSSLQIPLPPTAEQHRIVRTLNSLTSSTDELTFKTERSIALLAEHRSALITAAVTGQIDVRDAA